MRRIKASGRASNLAAMIRKMGAIGIVPSVDFANVGDVVFAGQHVVDAFAPQSSVALKIPKVLRNVQRGTGRFAEYTLHTKEYTITSNNNRVKPYK